MTEREIEFCRFVGQQKGLLLEPLAQFARLRLVEREREFALAAEIRFGHSRFRCRYDGLSDAASKRHSTFREVQTITAVGISRSCTGLNHRTEASVGSDDGVCDGLSFFIGDPAEYNEWPVALDFFLRWF